MNISHYNKLNNNFVHIRIINFTLEMKPKHKKIKERLFFKLKILMLKKKYY